MFEYNELVVTPKGEGRVVKASTNQSSVSVVHGSHTGVYRIERVRYPAHGESHPEVGSLHEHHSGRIYKVIGYANEATSRPEEYPVTIVYQNTENGMVWCRPLYDWSRSFVPI